MIQYEYRRIRYNCTVGHVNLRNLNNHVKNSSFIYNIFQLSIITNYFNSLKELYNKKNKKVKSNVL